MLTFLVYRSVIRRLDLADAKSNLRIYTGFTKIVDRGEFPE